MKLGDDPSRGNLLLGGPGVARMGSHSTAVGGAVLAARAREQRSAIRPANNGSPIAPGGRSGSTGGRPRLR